MLGNLSTRMVCMIGRRDRLIAGACIFLKSDSCALDGQWLSVKTMMQNIIGTGEIMRPELARIVSRWTREMQDEDKFSFSGSKTL